MTAGAGGCISTIFVFLFQKRVKEGEILGPNFSIVGGNAGEGFVSDVLLSGCTVEIGVCDVTMGERYVVYVMFQEGNSTS